ncbi:MAG: hypothetical protein P4L11_12765 [Geothrix sp.]|jgi:hypothetical protein|nr:hypothetical protein [Geothrix sp.]
MPSGHVRTQKPGKMVETATAEACIAIAQRVARTRSLADDQSGWSAATQVARFIEEELLGRAPQHQLGSALPRLRWKP